MKKQIDNHQHEDRHTKKPTQNVFAHDQYSFSVAAEVCEAAATAGTAFGAGHRRHNRYADHHIRVPHLLCGVTH
jgi:hypothetical protein